MDEREQLLQSLNIEFPTDEEFVEVDDEAIGGYVRMMDGANKLVDECLRLKKQLEESNKKLNCLAKGLEPIGEDEESGDVIFKLKCGTTRAHGSVVSSWSEPLAAMLHSGMYEGRNKCIEITTEEPQFVRMMLKFCYTSQADINGLTVLPLLRLSCLYAIDPLRDQCCGYLLERMNGENCVEIMNLAELMQVEELPMWEELAKKSRDYTISHFSDVLAFNESPLSDMDMSHVIGFIIIAFEKMEKDLPEYIPMLGNAIVNWAKVEWRVTTLSAVITHINNQVACYKMQLFVKASGNTYSVFIKKTSDIFALKVAIEKISGIPISMQRLTFEGKVICDAGSLVDCGICTDSTIHLSVTQSKRTIAAPSPTFTDIGDVEYLEVFRQYCIKILAIDFAIQSQTKDFLQLDYETLLSIITQESIHNFGESVVFTAVFNWLYASLDRNNPKTITQLVNSGCPHLGTLSNVMYKLGLNPRKKRRECTSSV